MALSTENKAYELLVALFEDAKETLKNQEEGDKETKKQRRAKRGERTKAGNKFQTLSRNIAEWEKWKTTRGAFTLEAQIEKWEELFGEDPNWDGETELIPFFRSKITELKENDLVKAQDRIASLDEELADIEDRLSDPAISARREDAARVEVGGASAEKIIDWLVGDADDDPDLVFRDELQALSEGQTDFESAGTFVYDNRLSAAKNRELKKAFEQGEVLAAQEGTERLLSYEGRLQLKEAIDNSLAPYSGPQLSAGEELSESEIIRETPIGGGSPETRGMQGPPNQIADTPNAMQAGLDEELALQRVQRENRGRDRGFDESLQEFGAPVDEPEILNPVEGDTRVNPDTGLSEKYLSGQWVAGSEGEDGEWIPGGTTEREILQGIGETFDVAAQFGYRFFFFEPGTQNPREDMLITDPDLLTEGGFSGPVNVLEYIKKQNLTDPNEIRAAFSTTKWFAETNELMQQFDLEWSAAASPGSLNDEITLRRRELIADQENYIRDQLALLGLEDKVTDDQITDLAILAKRTGMDNQAVRQTMTDVNSEFINFTSFAGEMDTGLLGVYKSGVENMAGQYMIGLSDASIDEWVTGMFESEDPDLQLALYREEMQQLAKERFPTIGGLIDQGMTPKQYFAPYKDKAELLLERPVDFMGGDANWFDKIANGTPDNETGSRVMTYTEANKYVRGLPEWQTTKNANDEAREIADNIGRMFGFVA